MVDRRCLGLALAVFFVLVGSSASRGGESAAKLTKVMLPIPSRSTNFAIFALARSRGYYREEGLDVDIVQVTPRIIVPSMVGGTFLISTVTTVQDIGINFKGIKMKFLMINADKPSFDVIAYPEIKNFKDLRGKVVASGNSFGDQPDQVLRAVLLANGIDPDKDVKLLYTGGTTPDRNLALRSKNADATLLTGEYSFKAQKDGFTKLAYSGDFTRSIGSGIAVLDDRLKERPPEVYAVVRATLKGLRFFRERKALSVQILKDWLRLDDLEAAERNYDFYVQGMTENGTTGGDVMALSIEQAKVLFKIPKERELKPSEIFDFSLVQKANDDLKASGWVP
jgi:ABC-type nitrate/sulfonate/bicarbonate transport system substrate-binding protein